MKRKLDGTRETIIYTSLKGIRIFHNNFENSYPLHWHAGLEIIMPYKHHYEIQIGNSTHILEEGDIMIVPPGELHRISPVEPEGKRHIMQIDYNTILGIPGLNTLISLYYPFRIIKNENIELCSKLSNYLRQAEKLYFEKSSFYEITVYSLILQFFDVLATNNLNKYELLIDGKTKKHTSYTDKIISACNYINSHFAEEISSKELAEESGFCHGHFCRVFKEFTGETFHNYLIRKRLSHAESLLLLPDLTITHIIMQSGFNSISTFNRVFRSVHDCSPTEFRNLIHSSI